MSTDNVRMANRIIISFSPCTLKFNISFNEKRGNEGLRTRRDDMVWGITVPVLGC